MARLNINVGTNANDGTGDDLRTAMQKINTNFTELYAETLVDSGISISGNTISSNRSDDDIVFEPSGTGAVRFPAILINDNSITGTRSNEDLTIAASGTGNLILGSLRVNGTTISTDDSTKITLSESVDITGTLTAAIFQVNEISSADSSAIQLNDSLNVSGTLTATDLVTNTIRSNDSSRISMESFLQLPGIVVNSIQSEDSSAIQIIDNVNISGTLTVAGGITGLVSLTRAAVTDGVATTNTSAQTSIDTTAAATYRGIRYEVSVSDSTNLNYALYNILITHDGTLAFISSNLVSSTGGDLGNFDADISGGNVRLLVTPATSDTVNYTFVKTAIVV